MPSQGGFRDPNLTAERCRQRREYERRLIAKGCTKWKAQRIASRKFGRG